MGQKSKYCYYGNSPQTDLYHSKQSNQNPSRLSVEVNKLIRKCTWKCKGSKIAQTILKDTKLRKLNYQEPRHKMRVSQHGVLDKDQRLRTKSRSWLEAPDWRQRLSATQRGGVFPASNSDHVDIQREEKEPQPLPYTTKQNQLRMHHRLKAVRRQCRRTSSRPADKTMKCHSTPTKVT